jgi:putative ABC transport system permease protein
MSLWKIAWRSIQQRPLASALTAVSMALGVSLVVALLVIQSVVYQSFHRGGEGYDLIVGAGKGSRLQLVLGSVYYLGQPVENIPYRYYEELDGRNEDGIYKFPELRGVVGSVQLAIPICLGDNYEGYRVVGTKAEMFSDLRYLGDQEYRFAEGGHNFDNANFFEAVIGATVARKTGLMVGDTFRPTHEGVGQDCHEHEPFTVVGILEPTGTPNDRAVFVNIEGFYRVGGHAAITHGATGAKKEPAGEHHDAKDADDAHDHHHEDIIPNEAKKVSAVLICTDPKRPQYNRVLARRIDGGSTAQAAIPSDEISQLFEGVIGNIELVLLLFAVMIVLVAGIGIMVSIYNSMSDRRHEIAIMRALGASRVNVMAIILLESILLSIGGGLLGLGLGHGVIVLLGPVIAEKTGFTVGMLAFRTMELILIPGLILLASVVGYLPAVAAYRTDVARSLQANP